MHNKVKGNVTSRRVISMVLAIALICSFGLTSVFAESGSTQDSGVKSITVTLTPTSIEVGKTSTAKAEVVLDSGSQAAKTVTWSSATPAVATVDNDGKVTGVKAGDAKIIATSTANTSVKGETNIKVTAKPAEPSVTSVTVSPKTADVAVYKTVKLAATVVADAGLAQTVTWSSSNDTVAFVNQDGTVHALKVGRATITATSTADKTKTDTAVITVTTPRNLTMYGSKATVGFAKPHQLFVFEWKDGHREDITSEIKKWDSTDKDVAAVKDGKGGGLITYGKKLGTTTITAIAEDESRVTCEVSVIPDLNYDALDDTYSLANAYTWSTRESTNGTDVAKNLYWTSEAALTTLETALETADNAQSPTATQATINAAAAALQKALNDFVGTLKMGTSNEIADANTVPLTKAIIAAWANYDSTDNASKEAFETYKNAIVAVETANIFTQAEADKALADLNKATAAFNAAKTSGGGSSGGSSGSSGGSSTPPPSADKPSSSVGGNGEVKADDIKNETSKAVADAVKAAPGATADVNVKNAETITPAALKDMAAAATKAGGKVQLTADTVVNGIVETRLYINPAQAAALKAPISLKVAVNSLEVDATKEKFAKFYDNEMAVASFAQQGAFGMKIEAAVKLDLTKLNTKTLVFYSYDKATNTYIPVAAPAYSIDKNGYLHFSTTVGGDILITDKPLTKKK